jgi:hypothetical protein
LEDPYRTAILLRYFEGLAPAAIAARTGTPLRTVHTRLHRALARLRAELDRAHGGDRRAWLLALIPFARGSRGWSAWGVGALVMDAKLKIALAAVAVVGVCSTIAWWPREEARVETESVAAAPAAPPIEPVDAPAPARALEDAPRDVERRAQEVPPAPAPAAAPPAARAVLAGRVIDVDRQPVAGVTVRYSDPSHGPQDGLEARTDATGAFELPQPPERGSIDVASAGWRAFSAPISRPRRGSASSCWSSRPASGSRASSSTSSCARSPTRCSARRCLSGCGRASTRSSTARARSSAARSPGPTAASR